MTREEAIKELIRAFDVLDNSCHMDNRRKEAFNMAKMALENKPRFILHSDGRIEQIIEPCDDVLGKIRADVINIADGKQSIKVRSVLRIIDKHKAESEG